MISILSSGNSNIEHRIHRDHQADLYFVLLQYFSRNFALSSAILFLATIAFR